ncbi:MAG: hypothetical protein Q9M94_00390 [Candidatus Gracilibacteria bacterium]|nr:hypothetical protein [Candidatus Gracilibacteria bacterium]MDQ7023117.1 hypothetical protein [Candidatus Gracilibacteria bacterium]
MKKILIILITTFLLFSCGNKDVEVISEDITSKEVGLRHFPGKDFSIQIPVAWNLITTNDDIIPSPNNGILELAVTSSETKNGFANNLIILSQDLETFTTSKNYVITNNVGAENEYLNYFKKSSKDFIFTDGEKSLIYNFEAKYSEETPILQFLQTAYVCKTKKAFFITLALPLDITDISKYEKMITSFKCK